MKSRENCVLKICFTNWKRNTTNKRRNFNYSMVLSKMLGLAADLLWLSNLSSILNLFQSLTTTTIFGVLLIYNYLRLQLHGYNKTIKNIFSFTANLSFNYSYQWHRSRNFVYALVALTFLQQ